jgi:HK97 family phage major capsid protein
MFDDHEIRGLTADLKKAANTMNTRTAELNARMTEVEQRMAGGGGFRGGYASHNSLGGEVSESEQTKAFRENGNRGMMRVQHTKSITSASNSGGALVAPDFRQEVITLPRTKLTVRSLLTVSPTTSNVIQHPRELVFTNNAGMVAEGALKPESNVTFELVESFVRTLATWLTASRQIMDDDPQLQSFLDVDLRHAIGQVEEMQVLFGAGIGENLHGLWPQATAYDTGLDAVGDTKVDTILKAVGQAERGSQLPVTGIIVNSVDWAGMLGLKDTAGQYLSNGPFGTTQRPTLWGIPVVDTLNMPAGQFLVGNFQQAATLYDRMTTEVLISSEHADFFTRNLLAVRAEERIALVVKRPSALVKASYPV